MDYYVCMVCSYGTNSDVKAGEHEDETGHSVYLAEMPKIKD